ncbi:hypothetical protein pdam_00013231 [Pocillopora damicornis]|uniref:Uncharacterized protein n=1 Tax=Pocillopora damicornis TaxID=46731 RepID=A0A3M6UB55_POCDA|nr:hypothetical protein pdam_00013231 [Pocillopora damicornis]
MTSNLNMKSRSIINVKQAQAHESTHAHVNFVSTTINNNNTLMTTNYQNGQFSNEDDIAGVKFINEDFHQLNEKKPER